MIFTRRGGGRGGGHVVEIIKNTLGSFVDRPNFQEWIFHEQISAGEYNTGAAFIIEFSFRRTNTKKYVRTDCLASRPRWKIVQTVPFRETHRRTASVLLVCSPLINYTSESIRLFEFNTSRGEVVIIFVIICSNQKWSSIDLIVCPPPFFTHA